mgnify:CR=1 FL=1
MATDEEGNAELHFQVADALVTVDWATKSCCAVFVKFFICARAMNVRSVVVSIAGPPFLAI